MSTNSDEIVFMHVPKCAGMMFVSALAQSIEAKEILGGFDRTLFGTFEAFDTIDEGLRRQIYLDEQPTDRAYRIVSGHKALSSLLAAYRGRPFATIMREPRIRLMSHFLFWRFTPEDNLALWGSFAECMRFARGSLQEFLEQQDVACQIDNLFTRFLLSPHPDIPPGDFIPKRLHESLYRESMAKLVRFDFVDIIENPTIGTNVAKWLGRNFTMTRANETIAHPDRTVDLGAELTLRVLARIESLTAIDRRLWIHVAETRNIVPKADMHADHLFVQYVARQAVSLSRYYSAQINGEKSDASEEL